MRKTAYRVATGLLAFECFVGGVLGATQTHYADVMQHMGYPPYLMTILGVWYMLAGVAMVGPRWPRAKEWAYAGLFFLYTGAAVSHIVTGYALVTLIPLGILLGLVGVSWALRPPDRREFKASPGNSTALYWIVTSLLVLETLAGGGVDLANGRTGGVSGPRVGDILASLGYPLYLLGILGLWKLLAAGALVLPRFRRLQEWAYAGLACEMTTAVVSQAICRHTGEIIVPAVILGLILASWALRPSDRLNYPRSMRA